MNKVTAEIMYALSQKEILNEIFCSHFKLANN